MENENKEDKNKRQIYVWQENIEFFNSLKNKSGLINRLLKKYREENDL